MISPEEAIYIMNEIEGGQGSRIRVFLFDCYIVECYSQSSTSRIEPKGENLSIRYFARDGELRISEHTKNLILSKYPNAIFNK